MKSFAILTAVVSFAMPAVATTPVQAAGSVGHCVVYGGGELRNVCARTLNVAWRSTDVSGGHCGSSGIAYQCAGSIGPGRSLRLGGVGMGRVSWGVCESPDAPIATSWDFYDCR